MKNNIDKKYQSINQLSNREAMGLPDYFQPSRLDDLQSIFLNLQNCTEQELITMAESKDEVLEKRYVAGQLLGKRGDPRISVCSPVMIDIPSATVEIGINTEQVNSILKQYQQVGVKKSWLLKETPRFNVTLDSFRVAKYPVTNQEYRVFLKETHYAELPSSWPLGIYPTDKANHPVYTISELAAEHYVKWLSDKTQRKFRLPKETEWEYAASGTTHCQYPWGNAYRKGLANTLEEKIYHTTPIGIFARGCSSFAISDMAGNVEEYTANDYAPYPGGQWISDNLIETMKCYRICRGGSFARYADLARTTRRHGRYPKAIYAIGFRLAESIIGDK